MTMPSPGWYSDPQDAQQSRWWDGSKWTEHQKRVDPAPPPTPEPYVPFANQHQEPVQTLSRGDKDKEIRKNNSMAYTGLVLALVAFLINPFAILSILGIVFSAIGLAKSHELERDGYRTHGRGTAIGGIIVGIVGLIAFALIAFS
ncbi:DUF2510 domain-containing protein [Homoserinimonas sp. A447]